MRDVHVRKITSGVTSGDGSVGHLIQINSTALNKR